MRTARCKHTHTHVSQQRCFTVPTLEFTRNNHYRDNITVPQIFRLIEYIIAEARAGRSIGALLSLNNHASVCRRRVVI